MPAENVFAQYAQPIRPMTDYLRDMDAQEAQQRQNALGALLFKQISDELQQTQNTRNALARIAGGWNATTTPDQRLIDLRNSGDPALMQQADALEQQWLKRRETEATIGKTSAETVGKQLDALKTLSQGVMANPTSENAAGALAQWERLTGQTDPNERAQIAQLQTPEQVMAWARAHAMKADDLKAQVFTNNTGGATVTQSYDPNTGKLAQLGSVKNTQSPDSVASIGVQIRGQNLTDKRERDLAAGQVTYQTDANGNMVALPTRTAPGAVVRGQAVVGPNGMAPIPGSNGGLNDTQAKALLFGTRMQEADKILADMAGQGVTQPSLVKRGADAVPLIGGGLGMLANATVASPKQQQVEQAQRDFVNAVLRRESGAAISASEFDSARQQYFPQPGDSKAVIEQKARNRSLAMQAMLAEVPQGKRTLPGAAQSSNAAPSVSNW